MLHRRILLLSVCGLLVVHALHFFRPVDDAYISFRYAENLAAGQGHPVEIMDMSFAIQALCAERLAKSGRTLAPRVHVVPREIDERVARMKLSELDVTIDRLTTAQRDYLASWTEGT